MKASVRMFFYKLILMITIALLGFQYISASPQESKDIQKPATNTILLTPVINTLISNNHNALERLKQKLRALEEIWHLNIENGIITESEMQNIESQGIQIQQESDDLIDKIRSQNDAIVKLTQVDAAQENLQNRLKELKDNSEATSQTYLLRLKQTHYLMTENKSIIFDIKGLQVQTQQLLESISNFRFNLVKNYMFIKREPLYSTVVYHSALNDSSTYITQFKQQFNQTKIYLLNEIKNVLFWITLLLIAAFSALYFWFASTVTKKSIKWRNPEITLSLKFILIGLIPSYFIASNIDKILEWLPYQNNIIYDSVVNSFIDSLISILIMVVAAQIIFRRYRTYKTKCIKPTIFFICATAIITFINGIESFSLNTRAILAFPSSSTSLVNFFFGFIYTSIMLWLLINILRSNRKNHLNNNQIARFIRTLLIIISFIIAIAYPLIVFIGFSNFINILIVNIIQTTLLLMFTYYCYQILVSLATFTINSIRAKAKLTDIENHSFSVYWIKFFIMSGVLTISIPLILLIWGVNSYLIRESLDAILFEGVNIGTNTISISYMLKAILIGLFAYYAVKLFNHFLNKRIYPYTNLQESTIITLDTMMGYLSIFLGVVLFLYALGITGTSLTFLASAFVLGISFGLQEIFKNLISGIILITERPMKIGDWVHADGKMGIVKKIQLRATVLETFNRETLIVPNSEFITKTISNELYNPTSRLVLNIEVSYNEDPRKVKEVLLDIASKTPNLIQSPEPSAVFTGFNASSLAFELRVFCRTDKQLSVGDHIRTEVLLRFREENIEIPYQKIDIQIKEVIQTKSSS